MTMKDHLKEEDTQKGKTEVIENPKGESTMVIVIDFWLFVVIDWNNK